MPPRSNSAPYQAAPWPWQRGSATPPGGTPPFPGAVRTKGGWTNPSGRPPMPGLPPSARQVTQYPDGVPTGVGGGNAGAAAPWGDGRVGSRTPRPEPPMSGPSQRTAGASMIPPPSMRVRPGDLATAMMKPSGPQVLAPDDRNYRHTEARYNGGVAGPDWRTGFEMPKSMGEIAGAQGWRQGFQPTFGVDQSPYKVEGGDQTNPALAKTIRGDAADMGDLAGTDLGSQLSSYMHEQANRMDPMGAGVTGSTLQTAFGSPNMLSGATSGMAREGAGPQADDAGDVGVPTGFRAPDGQMWNGKSWEADDAGDVGVPTGFKAPDGQTWNGQNWTPAQRQGDDSRAAPVTGFKQPQLGGADYSVKPLQGSPWASGDNLFDAFASAARGAG